MFYASANDMPARYWIETIAMIPAGKLFNCHNSGDYDIFLKSF
jgi:hypothetical protein